MISNDVSNVYSFTLRAMRRCFPLVLFAAFISSGAEELPEVITCGVSIIEAGNSSADVLAKC